MSSHDTAPGRPRTERAPGTDSPLPPPGSWALITGASGGLGRAFAVELASHGVNLVLTGRRREALDEVATAIGQEVRTVVLPADVADADARAELLAELERREIVIHTLVNNAGFGVIGPFVDDPDGRNLDQIRVNCEALTDFTQRLLPAMLERDSGAVINVASTASFQPLPNMAVYAGTKAYVRSFSEGLWFETRQTGVAVLALCPGPTQTGFFEAAGDGDALSWRRTPEQVVRTCFAALARRSPTVVDGPLNLAQALVTRLAPTKLALKVSSWVVG